MLVEILCVVNNDKLHLFELINSIRVACHVRSILTLGYFKKKLAEGVMAIVIVTTELDVFSTFLGVDLGVFNATPDQLI